MHSLTPSFIFFPIAQDFAVKGVHRDGVLDTELKSTYDTARYKFLASLAQASGNLTVSAAVKEVAPGLTVGVSGTLPDVNTAKLAVDYVAPHVTLKTSTSLTAAPKVDAVEVEETAALIDFVAVCRTYASELAINEVTLRTYSDLQHYVERSTESLVQSLRGGDAKSRSYRQMQVKAAIRFCEVLFGRDYALLMSRAAENSLIGERKPSRAAR